RETVVGHHRADRSRCPGRTRAGGELSVRERLAVGDSARRVQYAALKLRQRRPLEDHVVERFRRALGEPLQLAAKWRIPVPEDVRRGLGRSGGLAGKIGTYRLCQSVLAGEADPYADQSPLVTDD